MNRELYERALQRYSRLAVQGAPPPRRNLVLVSGVMTDHWFEWPDAWREWINAFHGWAEEEWEAFWSTWRRDGITDDERRRLMQACGLLFFDWRAVPGGSIRGSVRAAQALLYEQMRGLHNITLIGHSRGGNVIKYLLTAGHDWVEVEKPRHAIFIDAPIDWLREVCGWLLGTGIGPCRLCPEEVGVTCVTINNWLDPIGGRIRGARNYQTCIWNDYMRPYPPHGMKGRLARRVLADLGALPEQDAAAMASAQPDEPHLGRVAVQAASGE